MSQDSNSNFTLKDCLFGSVTLAKSADPDKCVYSGSGNGFDIRSFFSLPNFGWANAIIFGVHMRSSVHIDNEKKVILILGKGPT